MILEDNDAVIKMTIKGRIPNMRHVPRTYRVDLDWLSERLREDPSIRIQYVNTKQPIADILTNGSFTLVQWSHLCGLGQIGKSQRLVDRIKHLEKPQLERPILENSQSEKHKGQF